MISLQITTFGGSLGVALSEEALAGLRAREGDVLHLTPLSGGGFRLEVLDPAVAEQVRIGCAIMDRYDETFRALAK
jgi:hypothetical protein